MRTTWNDIGVAEALPERLASTAEDGTEEGQNNACTEKSDWGPTGLLGDGVQMRGRQWEGDLERADGAISRSLMG